MKSNIKLTWTGLGLSRRFVVSEECIEKADLFGESDYVIKVCVKEAYRIVKKFDDLLSGGGAAVY